MVVLVTTTNETQPINSTEEADYPKRKRDYFLPPDVDQPVLGPEHTGICTGLEASTPLLFQALDSHGSTTASSRMSLACTLTFTHITDAGICLSL